MGALQHLKVPWVWHLMDDVPVSICRFNGQVIEAAPSTRWTVSSTAATWRAPEQLVDEIEASGESGSGRTSRWCPTGSSATPPLPLGRGPTSPEAGRFSGSCRPARSTGTRGPTTSSRPPPRLRESGPRTILDRLLRQRRRTPIFPALDEGPRAWRGTSTFKGSRPAGRAGAALTRPTIVFAFPTWPREPFAFAPLEAAWRGCVPLMSQTQRQRRVVRPRRALPEGKREEPRRLRRRDRGHHGRLGRPRRRSPGEASAVVGRDFHLGRAGPQDRAGAGPKPADAGPVFQTAGHRPPRCTGMALLAEKLAPRSSSRRPCTSGMNPNDGSSQRFK